MEKRDADMDFGKQVVRYLSGEMTASEKRSFAAEIQQDNEKKRLFEEYTKLWVGLDQVAAESEYDMDLEWAGLAAKAGIGGYSASDQTAGETDEKVGPRIAGQRPFGQMVVRIAAAVVIGLISVTILYTVRQANLYDQVAVETGTEVISLPDGSRVTVNQGSSIKYFADAGMDTRKVKLTGEAYFEVARDTVRPFIIDAGAAKIEVLGTSFNVSAYEAAETVEVLVNSGLVAMSAKKEADNLIIMNPGNGGVYDRRKQELKLIPKADRNDIAWKTRELVFSATPLNQALRDISHAYRVQMNVLNPEIADCPITVSFSGQELGAVIRVLESMLDLEISREGDRYHVNGEGCGVE